MDLLEFFRGSEQKYFLRNGTSIDGDSIPHNT